MPSPNFVVRFHNSAELDYRRLLWDGLCILRKNEGWTHCGRGWGWPGWPWASWGGPHFGRGGLMDRVGVGILTYLLSGTAMGSQIFSKGGLGRHLKSSQAHKSTTHMFLLTPSMDSQKA